MTPETQHSINLVRLYGVDDVRVDNAAMPVCEAGDYLIRVEACGICGSDIGYIAEGGTIFGNPLPMALGHEFAGTVTKAGSSVPGIKEGQRVVICPIPGAVGNGGPDGGFTHYFRVPASDAKQALYPVPMSLPAENAALAEPLSVGLHAVRRSGAKPGDRVVVLGVGCIGLSIVAGLSAQGVTDIVAVDVSPFRLETAKALGANNTINVTEADLEEQLNALHGREEIFGLLPAVSTDIYLDTTASPGVIAQLISMAKLGAVISYVGLYKQPVSLDLQQALYREVDIRPSLAYSDEDFKLAIELLSNAKLDFSPMISHQFPIAEFHQALAVARDSSQSNKVIITFQ